jgi:hypothetical protein
METECISVCQHPQPWGLDAFLGRYGSALNIPKDVDDSAVGDVIFHLFAAAGLSGYSCIDGGYERRFWKVDGCSFIPPYMGIGGETLNANNLKSINEQRVCMCRKKILCDWSGSLFIRSRQYVWEPWQALGLTNSVDSTNAERSG